MFQRKKGNAFGLIIIVFLAIVIISLITNNPKNNNLSKSQLEIPAEAGYVNDFAGVISIENKNNLDSYLKQLDKKTGAEVAVVTLPSLKGNSIEDVALNIGRKWGVGKKGKNNGVVILVATGDKKMRIEVGYGLEGIIPDGKAGRIRDDYMIPFFKQGETEKGIINGTFAIASEISKAYNVTIPSDFNSLSNMSSSSQTSSEKTSGSDIFIFLIFIILFIVLPRRGLFIGGYTNYGEGFGGSSSGFSGFGGGGFGGGGASGGW